MKALKIVEKTLENEAGVKVEEKKVMQKRLGGK